MAASRREILMLYKQLLKESSKFPTYMYRTYAVRRVKDSFREHKDEVDVEKIQELISYGKSNLEIIKRQIIIGKMYQSPDLVIEHNMQMGKKKTLEGG